MKLISMERPLSIFLAENFSSICSFIFLAFFLTSGFLRAEMKSQKTSLNNSSRQGPFIFKRSIRKLQGDTLAFFSPDGEILRRFDEGYPPLEVHEWKDLIVVVEQAAAGSPPNLEIFSGSNGEKFYEFFPHVFGSLLVLSDPGFDHFLIIGKDVVKWVDENGMETASYNFPELKGWWLAPRRRSVILQVRPGRFQHALDLKDNPKTKFSRDKYRRDEIFEFFEDGRVVSRGKSSVVPIEKGLPRYGFPPNYRSELTKGNGLRFSEKILVVGRRIFNLDSGMEVASGFPFAFSDDGKLVAAVDLFFRSPDFDDPQNYARFLGGLKNVDSTRAREHEKSIGPMVNIFSVETGHLEGRIQVDMGRDYEKEFVGKQTQFPDGRVARTGYERNPVEALRFIGGGDEIRVTTNFVGRKQTRTISLRQAKGNLRTEKLEYKVWLDRDKGQRDAAAAARESAEFVASPAGRLKSLKNFLKWSEKQTNRGGLRRMQETGEFDAFGRMLHENMTEAELSSAEAEQQRLMKEFFVFKSSGMSEPPVEGPIDFEKLPNDVKERMRISGDKMKRWKKNRGKKKD